MSIQVQQMPRKKQKKEEGDSKQIAFRCPLDILHRIEAVAPQLGLDVSNFLRMMLVENLAAYERRASAAREGTNEK